ncbi:hypothetical protein KIH39_10550 [Telmatocola sphagniphila]|uniref:Peptidase C45 hydrolase domain-containing protein n=1 Tax=Telmatocola sphagniphila TaxID=1123043 RepID=A0A8E6BAC0_9BACT|nr:C45 family peptidase [Telmatocola sphagniphila]QVL34319.1 hypothetical protein KIH39_10550 [Telmatocola sphagniphila]
MRYLWSFVLCLASSFPLFAQDAHSKFVYKEQTEGPGKLQYVKGIPVLVVEGTPEELGKQYGAIAMSQGKNLLKQIDGFVDSIGFKSAYPLLLKMSAGMLDSFPKDHRTEIESAAKASGIDLKLLIFANTVADLKKIGGCSTLIVEKTRSQTGEPLFGRLLDWPPFEGLAQHSLIVVEKPKGKHAFAALTISPLIGVVTAMNDSGLCLTINEIYATKDKTPPLDVTGTPMLLLFRRVMEECENLDQAEKLVREAKRTGMYVLTLCDKSGGRVLEVTTKNVVPRTAENGVCCTTNHFRTEELSVHKKCDRYAKLQECQKCDDKYGVPDVVKSLDRVNQGKSTIHAVVFEPSRRVMHVSVGGDRSATKNPFEEIELTNFFKK